MMAKRNRKAIALIVMVMFIAVGSLVAVLLSIMLTTEFSFATINYKAELVFFAADSAIARAEELVVENGDCSWIPDPPGYLEEEYSVPAGSDRTLYYKIYCTEHLDGEGEVEEVEINVESGIGS